jgi:hypothetical protein
VRHDDAATRGREIAAGVAGDHVDGVAAAFTVADSLGAKGRLATPTPLGPTHVFESTDA